MDALVQEHPDTTIVTGVGQHQMWAAQFLSFNHENTFVSSGGLGAMGFELPAALGAQVAKPEAPVWVVAGDGGFQMTLQELVTLTEEKLPVKIALVNNGHLGMVKQWQEMYYDGHLKAVPVEGPDFIKLAEAYGVGAIRVTEHEDVPTIIIRRKGNCCITHLCLTSELGFRHICHTYNRSVPSLEHLTTRCSGIY